MTLDPLSTGGLLTWDATCMHRLARCIDCHQNTPAADSAEANKIDKYSGLGSNFVVQLIIVETLGPFGKSSSRLITFFSKRICSA